MPRAYAKSRWNPKGAEAGDRRTPYRKQPDDTRGQYRPKQLARRQQMDGKPWPSTEKRLSVRMDNKYFEYHRPGSQNPRKG